MTFEEKLALSVGLTVSALTLAGAVTLGWQSSAQLLASAREHDRPVAGWATKPVMLGEVVPNDEVEPMISDEAEPIISDEVAKQHRALFFGVDDRVLIPAPYPAPYAAIGQLITKNDYTCTATLVAPDLAVTAAHCFMMEAKKADRGLWFKAGFHRGQYQAKYQIITQIFHPAFQRGLQYKGDDVYILPEAAEHDIAWLKLKLVEGVAPAPMPLFSGNRQQLASEFVRANNKLNQGGYAEDHDTILTVHMGCELSKFRGNNTLFHRCDTLSGDSGSPIWLTTDAGPLLVAVQSSAPDWFNRKKADNVGVSVLQLPAKP